MEPIEVIPTDQSIYYQGNTSFRNHIDVKKRGSEKDARLNSKYVLTVPFIHSLLFYSQRTNKKAKRISARALPKPKTKGTIKYILFKVAP